MMTRKIMLFLAVLTAFVLLGVYACRLAGDNADLRAENARSKANADVLAGQCERYRTSDSLSAARVRSLELTLDEFGRYRAADAALIKQLKQKNRDLAEDLSAQSALLYWLRNVSPTGTFVKKAGVDWPTGVSGIPDGWTVEEV